jgi:hypothetical protein
MEKWNDANSIKKYPAIKGAMARDHGPKLCKIALNLNLNPRL